MQMRGGTEHVCYYLVCRWKLGHKVVICSCEFDKRSNYSIIRYVHMHKPATEVTLAGLKSSFHFKMCMAALDNTS